MEAAGPSQDGLSFCTVDDGYVDYLALHAPQLYGIAATALPDVLDSTGPSPAVYAILLR